ncbi:MAG: hypothetical protein FWF95_03635 [Syntrophorhabdaceae bacterium]|nr:hypothetical protein [Syntrophorhabdaceae bacterium]
MIPPSDRRYSRSHIWALPVSGGKIRMGLTHVPGRFLGDAVSVGLPNRDTAIAAGEPIGLVGSSLTVFEIVSPLTGSVVDANSVAEIVPRNVTRDPYAEGWLLEITPSDCGEMDFLLSADDYEKYSGEG